MVAVVLLSLASGSPVLFYPSFPSHNKDELFAYDAGKDHDTVTIFFSNCTTKQ